MSLYLDVRVKLLWRGEPSWLFSGPQTLMSGDITDNQTCHMLQESILGLIQAIGPK